MENTHPVAANDRRRIKIQKPEIKSPFEETLWRDVIKYSKLIPQEPDVNLGRVQEIREEISKGTYLSPDKMSETAARLAIRFYQKDE